MKPTLVEYLNRVRKFIIYHGHTSQEFGGCDRIRGPYPETWIDNKYPCTCGYDDAIEAMTAVTEDVLKLRDSDQQEIKSDIL